MEESHDECHTRQAPVWPSCCLTATCAANTATASPRCGRSESLRESPRRALTVGRAPAGSLGGRGAEDASKRRLRSGPSEVRAIVAAQALAEKKGGEGACLLCERAVCRPSKVHTSVSVMTYSTNALLGGSVDLCFFKDCGERLMSDVSAAEARAAAVAAAARWR